MDGRGRLGARNWEFSDCTGHAESDSEQASAVSVANSAVCRLQETSLRMSSYPHRDALIGQHHSDVSAVHFTWVPQRNFLSHSKDLNQPHATPVSSEMIDIQTMPITVENPALNGEFEAKPPKVRKQRPAAKKANRVAGKVLKPKEPKKQSSAATKKKGSSVSSGKPEKKNEDHIVEPLMVDFSNVPVPVCSCTGVPRRCYRWGAGGWQSSCCTTTISEYPLPMSPSRRGARVAGRKMSIGAYAKLLQRLAAEGHDLSYAVDLKDHWARHGTNKFVTIR